MPDSKRCLLLGVGKVVLPFKAFQSSFPPFLDISRKMRPYSMSCNLRTLAGVQGVEQDASSAFCSSGDSASYRAKLADASCQLQVFASPTSFIILARRVSTAQVNGVAAPRRAGVCLNRCRNEWTPSGELYTMRGVNASCTKAAAKLSFRPLTVSKINRIRCAVR